MQSTEKEMSSTGSYNSEDLKNYFSDEPQAAAQNNPDILSSQKTDHLMETHPKTPSRIYLYLLFGGLVLIAGGLFFIRQKYSGVEPPPSQITLSPTEVPESSVTPSPETSTIEDWVTFENQNMGFSIKYPAYYIPKEETDLGPDDKRVNFRVESGDVGNYNFDSFSVHVSKAVLPDFPYDEKPSGGYTLDGMKGIYAEFPKGYGDGPVGYSPPFVVVYAEKQGELYQIKFNGVSDVKNQTITQILSTFKFTSSEKTSSIPSGFTTYKNSAYNYNLSFPSTWKAYDQSSGPGVTMATSRSELVDIMDTTRPASLPYPSEVVALQHYSEIPALYSSWKRSDTIINDIPTRIYENSNEGSVVYIFTAPEMASFMELRFNGSKEVRSYKTFEQIASTFKFVF